MPYVAVSAENRRDLLEMAGTRWAAVLESRPDLAPAVELQRRLITLEIDLAAHVDAAALPRLSLPPRYVAAKLDRGVPALAGEPIPVPTATLAASLSRFCDALAAGGAGAVAEHIRDAIESGGIDAASLLTASLLRNQNAIRTGAAHRGLAPDLVWLVAELAAGPFAHALQRMLFAGDTAAARPGADALVGALETWNHGYCPACGSWPALAEVARGHRTLRCSFCAAAWELKSYACVYCGESGEAFVTAAPDEERKDRRVEICGACGAYLKTLDVSRLSPFPLLAIADLETMDLDAAAMGHNYVRPPLKEFVRHG
jgi:hypothetical protein